MDSPRGVPRSRSGALALLAGSLATLLGLRTQAANAAGGGLPRWLASYVENTTTAVLLNPEVQQARAGYQREQGGWGRGPPKDRTALDPRTRRHPPWSQRGRVRCLSSVRGSGLCATATRRTRRM